MMSRAGFFAPFWPVFGPSFWPFFRAHLSAKALFHAIIAAAGSRLGGQCE
jgi:hypothetical protein